MADTLCTTAKPVADDMDDLFQFTETLRLSDDENELSKAERPVLPAGIIDVLGDRGVLLEVTRPPTDSSSPMPCERLPFVELEYEGWVVGDGENTRFDSTRDNGYSLTVQLDLPVTGQSSLIRAWEAALQHVRAGEIVILTASARYAYGVEGMPPVVPPNSALRFEIEILDVRATPKKVAAPVDDTQDDLSRLEQIRRDREIAQQRRADEQELRDAEKRAKAEKASAIQAKLAAKLDKKNGQKNKKGKKR
jgi:FK506-binding protein 1